MKIKEIIVVEGKDDTRAIQSALDADTIETNGSAISGDTIEVIRHAQRVRGVIVFTDPDFPGEKIRKTIAAAVPDCKHAFLDKEEARPKHGRGLGVEHASKEAILEALRHAQTMQEEPEEQITKDDLIHWGLIGGPAASRRREQLGKLLKIGYTNGKQLHKRLMAFQISPTAFAEAMKRIDEEK